MYYLLSTVQYNVLSFIYCSVQCNVTLHVYVCAGQYISSQDGINQMKEVAWVNLGSVINFLKCKMNLYMIYKFSSASQKTHTVKLGKVRGYRHNELGN
jgi:hypothetical protein